MGKKKKKKKNIFYLEELDNTLDKKYEETVDEIKNIQIRLDIADRKARKKARKLVRKGRVVNYDQYRLEARKEIITEMEGTNFLDRMYKLLNDMTPSIILIARLIASLIISLLQIDRIKVMINPKTLELIDKVYKKVMSIH